MRRLINTKLFTLFDQINQNIDLDEDYIKLAYDDFINAVAFLSISSEGDVPAYFTLHYTRLELESFQLKLITEGAEKK